MDTLGTILIIIGLIVVVLIVLRLTGVISFSKNKIICTRKKIELMEIGLNIFDVPMKDQVLLSIQDQDGNNVEGTLIGNGKEVSLPLTFENDVKYVFAATQILKGTTVYGIYGNCLI